MWGRRLEYQHNHAVNYSATERRRSAERQKLSQVHTLAARVLCVLKQTFLLESCFYKKCPHD